MKVIIVNAANKKLEFTCEYVNYSINNNSITNMIFQNPSINIPDWFNLGKVKSFEDNGNVLTIYLG